MTRTNHFGALTAIAAAAIAAAFMAYGTALAQVSTGNTITVTSNTDNPGAVGSCSLRKAIQAANTNAAVDPCPAGSPDGEDTIVFDATLTGQMGEILLNSQLPNITDPKGLVIDGRTNGIVVSGNTTVGIFAVNSGAQLTLKNLTLVDGKAPQGAGVANSGTLSVSNSAFTGNKADVFGGGIYSEGQLNLTNSTFSDNSALRGGGIFKNGGTGSVTNSTFSGNSATVDGGAIRNFGELSVTNSTFSGNSAGSEGGGIGNGGSGTMNDITTELFLTNDTFSGNSAGSGGGGGGIAHRIPGTAKLTNTIVANSPSGGNCFGDINFTDDGYNISSDASCAFSQQTSKSSTDPKLATTLANNGGPTQTIALLAGSPAVNAIPQGVNRCGATATNPLTTDQRGVTRPQLGACDIGAFEFQAPPPPKKKKKKRRRHHRHH